MDDERIERNRFRQAGGAGQGEADTATVTTGRPNKLILVETKRAGDMIAFYCDTCDQTFWGHSLWPVQTTYWLHEHRDKVRLTLERRKGAE